MTRAKQMAEARARASIYAPGPVGSHLTYGFVSLSLLGFALVFLARFYSVDLLVYPFALIALAIVAVLFSLLMRRLWKRGHRTAVAAEFANPGAGGARKRSSRAR